MKKSLFILIFTVLFFAMTGSAFAQSDTLAPLSDDLTPDLTLSLTVSGIEIWTCPNGHTGNTGNFCSECGEPKPKTDDDGTWTCENGHSGNKGKFCSECGAPKPADTPAEEPLNEADWDFEILADGTVRITGYRGDSANLTVPARMADGKPVVTIAENAFKDNAVIVNVTLAEGIERIENWGFRDCPNLVSIKLPKSLTSVNGTTWEGCPSLAEISISPDNPYYKVTDNVLFSKNGKELVAYPAGLPNDYYKVPAGTAVIGQRGFVTAANLKTVELPDGIISIEIAAFWGCTNLSGIKFPDSIRMIGTYAFQECTALRSMTFPEGLVSIGYAAFYKCSNLVSVNLPESVTEINAWAFAGCTNLASIYLPPNITEVKEYTFYKCTALSSILIPEKVTSIGTYAFAWTDLYMLNLPAAVQFIGDWAIPTPSHYFSLIVEKGSYGESWAIQNHYSFQYAD